MLELTSIEISNLTWAKAAIGHNWICITICDGFGAINEVQFRWVWPWPESSQACPCEGCFHVSLWCSCGEAESLLLIIIEYHTVENYGQSSQTVLFLVPVQLKIEWRILTLQDTSRIRVRLCFKLFTVCFEGWIRCKSFFRYHSYHHYSFRHFP